MIETCFIYKWVLTQGIFHSIPWVIKFLTFIDFTMSQVQNELCPKDATLTLHKTHCVHYVFQLDLF